MVNMRLRVSTGLVEHVVECELVMETRETIRRMFKPHGIPEIIHLWHKLYTPYEDGGSILEHIKHIKGCTDAI